MSPRVTGLGMLVTLGVMTGMASADPKVLKGPYLQDLAPTSITVMWQFDEPSDAKLIVEGPGGVKTLEIPKARMAEARVEGLEPSSRYVYR
ncbi:MAG: fibronectin type III domain-containing protein, partial [Deltaproteobacteria bacterium]|nr:fibronectin type III domain-containing protein [Deltaproteobacteria bacterium]